MLTKQKEFVWFYKKSFFGFLIDTAVLCQKIPLSTQNRVEAGDVFDRNRDEEDKSVVFEV